MSGEDSVPVPCTLKSAAKLAVAGGSGVVEEGGVVPVSSSDVHVSERVAASKPRALYIHVPFCLHHCGYCDFTVVAKRDSLIPRYLAALKAEIGADRSESTPTSSEPAPIEVDSIFIGGGTPTHLSPADLTRLFSIIAERFVLTTNGELTIEANPDGLCDERLDVLATCGVNRISLGVQSFDESVLKTLERTHSPHEAMRAIERARSSIANVSLDLIFGVPGQSLESWSATLQSCVQLPVSHVSTYGLTFESGTPYFRRERSGQLVKVVDELERDMYLSAITALADAGFQQYEISNFARSGFECRHNQVYWDAGEYFAFGPGASRYVNGVRSTNHRSVARWLNAVEAEQSAIAESEELSPEDKAREAIMLALRMNKGLHVPAFESRFGVELVKMAGPSIEKYVSQGLLTNSEDHLRLSPAGRLIADSVVADFL